MKGIDKTNPDRWREDVAPIRSPERFLDFDPVAPELPQEQSTAAPMCDEDQPPCGNESCGPGTNAGRDGS